MHCRMIGTSMQLAWLTKTRGCVSGSNLDCYIRGVLLATDGWMPSTLRGPRIASDNSGRASCQRARLSDPLTLNLLRLSRRSWLHRDPGLGLQHALPMLLPQPGYHLRLHLILPWPHGIVLLIGSLKTTLIRSMPVLPCTCVRSCLSRMAMEIVWCLASCRLYCVSASCRLLTLHCLLP